MIDEESVRKLALAIGGVSEEPGTMHFVANGKGIAWPYLEKVHPKKARVERRDVLAVRVEGEEVKQALLASDTEKFFTTDHYNGYPAVLVRLAAIEPDELGDLLVDACEAALRTKKRSRRKSS